MNKFEIIQIGDKAELTHIITQTDVEKFVNLTGDDNKIHIDKEYASKTSFKRPVAHGMLGASFISTVIGTKLPGDGALWYKQNLEFLMPVRVGDSITIKAEVIKKTERTHTIELSTDIYNQNKQKVTSGTALVKIIDQKQTEPISNAKEIKRKVVLVIGGTGGIGKATCLQLAKEGYDIVVHYLKNVELAENIVEQIKSFGNNAISVKADITDAIQTEEMVQKIIRKFNTITGLVNCATISIPSIKFCDLGWENLKEHFEINIKGSFNILKNVVPIMEQHNYGKIVNLGTLAVDKPNGEWLHYITAKSALTGFTKALAFELGPKGIRINMVSPGMTDTELIEDVPEKVRLLAAMNTPLRKIATPEDIAGVISFLVSEKSDYLTGETIRTNGGQMMI